MLKKSFLFVNLASIIAQTAANAHELSATTAAAFTATQVATSAASLATTGVSSILAEKRALAMAAVEDSAHYYESGKLEGVLPQVLKRMRTIDPELRSSPDATLVDSIVETASQILEQESL